MVKVEVSQQFSKELAMVSLSLTIFKDYKAGLLPHRGHLRHNSVESAQLNSLQFSLACGLSQGWMWVEFPFL